MKGQAPDAVSIADQCKLGVYAPLRLRTEADAEFCRLARVEPKGEHEALDAKPRIAQIQTADSQLGRASVGHRYWKIAGLSDGYAMKPEATRLKTQCS